MDDVTKLVLNKNADYLKWAAKLAVDIIKLIASSGLSAVAGALGGLVGDIGSAPDYAIQDKINELVDAINSLRQEVADAYLLFTVEIIDGQMSGALQAWEYLLEDPRPKLESNGMIDLDYARLQVSQCDLTLVGLGPGVIDDPAQHPLWLGPYQLLQDIIYSHIPWFGIGSGAYDSDGDIAPDLNPKDLIGFHFVAPTQAKPGSSVGRLIPRPEPDQGHYAFRHMYILPRFLQAIAIYLAVGGVLLPGFSEERGKTIRKYAQFLSKVYYKIVYEGLIMLSPPSPSEIYSIYNLVIRPEALPDELRDVAGVDVEGYLAGGEWREYSRFQPFGAVELYSGSEAIGSYPRIKYSEGDFEAMSESDVDSTRTLRYVKRQKLSSDWLKRFYGKFRIRSLVCSKVLFRELSLDQLRDTVNGLCDLIGDPRIIRGARFEDWSIREVFVGVNDSALPLSVRALMGFIQGASPTDTDGSMGLRAILTGDVKAGLTAL